MELRIPYKILLLAWFFTLPTKAQVPSENYVQTTERISDTESLTTTQYYDGLGRPYEKVEHGITNTTNSQKTINYCGNVIYDGNEIMVLNDITNVIPFSSGFRDTYTPTDRGDYNRALLLSDVASSKMGNGLNKSDGAAIAVGATAVAAGASSLVTTGGTSSIVSVPAVAIGKELAVAGAAASATGNVMMMNAKSNKAQGYDRGKKSNVSAGNKNSQHANQKRKEVNKIQYKQLKEQFEILRKMPNKTQEIKAEKDKIQKQLKRAKLRGDYKGENHSRNSKGNR